MKDGEDKGPHAFLVDLDSRGVKKEDMARKCAFNGLDNVYLSFDNVELELDSLLSGISYVDEDGSYQFRKGHKTFNFMHVAQRLLSGRICIAGSSLALIREVIEEVKTHTEKRQMPIGRDETTPLAKLPVIKDTIDSIVDRWNQLSRYMKVRSMVVQMIFSDVSFFS